MEGILAHLLTEFWNFHIRVWILAHC